MGGGRLCGVKIEEKKKHYVRDQDYNHRRSRSDRTSNQLKPFRLTPHIHAYILTGTVLASANTATCSFTTFSNYLFPYATTAAWNSDGDTLSSLAKDFTNRIS